MARLFAALLLIALPALSWAQSIPAMTWGAEVNASASTPGTEENWPRVAAVGDTVHVTWWSSGASGSAYYKRSLDGGVTWQNLYLFESGLPGTTPEVIAAGNLVLVFWEGAGGQLRYARSTDAGLTWSSSQDLSPAVNVWAFGTAMEGSRVVVFWTEVSGSTVSLKMRLSTDQGQNWSAAANVTSFNYVTNEGVFADVAIANSAIVFGYRDGPPWVIRTVRSTDWGQNWSSPPPVYSGSEILGSLRMAASGASVVMRWARFLGAYNDEAWGAASADGGATWSTPSNLSAGISGTNYYGDVCIWGNRAIFMFRGNTGTGVLPLYYRRSMDGGQTWEPIVQIPMGLTRFDVPSCTSTDRTVYIAGYSTLGDYDIWVVRGQAWGADLEISGKIAFSAARDGLGQIYTMDSDGSSQARLAVSAFYAAAPSWSPDGTKIALVDAVNAGIYLMNADGTGQVNLTTTPDYAVTWSPDGTKIALYSERDGNGEIYVMNPDGTGSIRLTNNPAFDGYVSWSPDGTKIAFESSRDGGDHEIYVMNADGTGQTRVTTAPGIDYQPAWSPDGTKILFTSRRNGGQDDIYVINPDGTGETRLTSSALVELGPAWSTDGTKIVYTVDQGSNYEVYIMNADGSNQTRLTNNAAGDMSYSGGWGEAFRRIGAAAVGSSASRTLTIKNRGDATLNVSNITSSDGQFTLSPASFSVAAGSSQTVTITFTPTSGGGEVLHPDDHQQRRDLSYGEVDGERDGHGDADLIAFRHLSSGG